MQIVVIAGGHQQSEFHDKGIAEGITIQFVTAIEDVHTDADSYFYLLDETHLEADKAAIGKLPNLVFVNAVASTLDQLPPNSVRINGWPGFLLSKSLELVARENNKARAIEVLGALGWQFNFIPDIAGMITPRVVAMIINEAYFAIGDNISSREDIDTAMKLGTGYPFGPFEWAEHIGLKKVHDLLKVLAQSDNRYEPAPLLTQEAQ